MNFLNGKKTYIIVALFVVAFVAAQFIPIPEYVWGILGALGLGAVRSALQKVSGNAGWKTYLAAISVAVVSVLSALGISLPLEVVYSVLGALGVVGVRDAINDILNG